MFYVFDATSMCFLKLKASSFNAKGYMYIKVCSFNCFFKRLVVFISVSLLILVICTCSSVQR